MNKKIEIRDKIYEIQKLEIDLKKHHMCYPCYIADYFQYICCECMKIVIAIQITRMEIKSMIKKGAFDD